MNHEVWLNRRRLTTLATKNGEAHTLAVTLNRPEVNQSDVMASAQNSTTLDPEFRVRTGSRANTYVNRDEDADATAATAVVPDDEPALSAPATVLSPHGAKAVAAASDPAAELRTTAKTTVPMESRQHLAVGHDAVTHTMSLYVNSERTVGPDEGPSQEDEVTSLPTTGDPATSDGP